MIKTIEPGIYEHYKSSHMRYEVIGVALSSETHDEYVIYKPLYQSNDINPEFWIRPYELFVSTVNIDGKLVPRFRKVFE